MRLCGMCSSALDWGRGHPALGRPHTGQQALHKSDWLTDKRIQRDRPTIEIRGTEMSSNGNRENNTGRGTLQSDKHTLVVYNTVQYKQWVHTWSICQSNLQILQHNLQHRPGSVTNTPNTQQHTDRTHSAIGAQGSPQPGFNQVIPLHQRAPWCDVSLTPLTSWRGKPLHQGSSRSVHAAQRYKQYYAGTQHTCNTP